MSEFLRQFIDCLDRAKPALTTEQQDLAPGVEEIADMLWLAAQMAEQDALQEISAAETTSEGQGVADPPPPTIPSGLSDPVQPTPSVPAPPPTESVGVLSTQETTTGSATTETGTSRRSVERLKVPAAAALRHPLQLIRALRPLARKVDSRTRQVIDEEATAIALAEGNPIGIIQQPEQERWLDLELVIEQSRIAALWDRTSKEWADLLSGSGLFRSVRVWTLGASQSPEHSVSEQESSASSESVSPQRSPIRLASGPPSTTPRSSRWATPKELLNPTGQSLIMVLSDCVSPRWWQGQIQPVLGEWAQHGPVVLVQWFPPDPYWDRTALKLGYSMHLKALTPGLPNPLLLRQYQGLNPELGLDLLEDEEPVQAVILPVVSLEAKALESWSRMVAGYGDARVTGRRFDLTLEEDGQWSGPVKTPRSLPVSGQQRVELFWQTASDLAQELAGLMSLGPVSPEITNLIQATLLPQSGPMHVAEVFLSGLLEVTEQGYAFVPEAKAKLQTGMLMVDEQLVFQVLSEYISERYGRTPREFEVFLQKHPDWQDQDWQQIEGFAELRQRLTSQDDASSEAEPLISPDPEPELEIEQLEATSSSSEEQTTEDEWQLDPEARQAIPRAAIELIRQFDGFVTHAYADPIYGWEVPTIGYGTTVYPNGQKVQQGDQITPELAENYLYYEIYNQIRPNLEAIPTWPQMNDNQRSALYSFAYNLGADFYGNANFASITRVADSLDRWTDAAWITEQFVKYRNPGTSAEAGLRRRRETEARLFVTPVEPTLNFEPLNVTWGTLATDSGPEAGSASTTPPLPFETTNYTVAQLVEEEEIKVTPEDVLPSMQFTYTVVKLNPDGSEQERYQDTTTGFIELLEERISLEMIAIPGGEFLMGAPDTEESSGNAERPQHRVTVPPFYLGRTPITQAQWRIVAGWDKVERDLKPNPSHFKGDSLPVERVSWDDATEFCARLSQRLQREYHLPSEAQWEYACRAGTTTPFHFGETLSTDVANYRGNTTDSQGRKGVYRKKTTPVGSLKAANAWGLLDMHGNAWEWCQDDWHSKYKSAPEDGSAWLDKNNGVTSKVRRGGSWSDHPWYCRSACRYWYSRDFRNYDLGFRVACPAPRTLAL